MKTEVAKIDGSAYEELRLALEPLGLYVEEQTHWYSAVYGTLTDSNGEAL